MNESKKYCRTLHAQISLGTSSDDRFMPSGYVKAFAEMEDLVLTEKLDGQNNCFNKEGVFARSHAVSSEHPWDKPLRERWQLIKNDLKELEIFGENMYAIHSIAYRKLESFFYVFAIREGDYWLPWEEVKFYAEMLDFPTVPEIPIKTPLKAVFDEKKDENQILADWFTANLGKSWEESVETPGLLGGYDPNTLLDCSEGFVVRNKQGFLTNSGTIPVADNEFDQLFKLVRKAHVKTDVHWTKNWKPTSLIDYEKYKWYGYTFGFGVK
ncbi:MAG: RNA ligase family protein [Microscillaceae bacterium]|nr:RNA ligase family protein [Microscillaceae bacterium]